jgi:FAD/FMN-containing dehydrogenase
MALNLRSRIPIAGLDGEPVEVDPGDVAALAARLDGPMLTPADARFEGAIQTWNAMIKKRPALVVQPASSRDVVHAIRFADSHRVLLSVKGGGHHLAGTSLTDGGLTLDMSGLRSVEVDPERRLVRVGAGCRLGDVDRATQKHGLATVLGSDADTGVGGLTLGGGFGSLSRRFGWTVDNLEEVEVATADGELRHASETENTDLFWALRGGGGNFGVVTRFTFRLHEVGPLVTGGIIVWEAEKANEVLGLYREITEAAPRELTLALSMRIAPAAPFIPERVRGTPVIAVQVCHTGDLARAGRDLAPLRAIEAVADGVVQKPYVEQQLVLGAPQPNGFNQYWKSEFLSTLQDTFLSKFTQQAGRITSPLSQVILFQLGGAVADREAAATAFGNRDAAYVFLAAGCWPPEDSDAERHLSWARSTWNALAPFSTGGNYVNAHTGDEDESRVRAAYRDSLDRLVAVKAAYDPGNLFRANRTLSPTPRESPISTRRDAG